MCVFFESKPEIFSGFEKVLTFVDSNHFRKILINILIFDSTINRGLYYLANVYILFYNNNVQKKGENK